MILQGAALASRKEVTAAVESQPPGQTVLVSDGNKLLASREGHGESAVLILLDVVKSIEAGMHFAARPDPEIQAALKKRAKAERKAIRPDGRSARPPREGARTRTEGTPTRKAPAESPKPVEPPAPSKPGQTSMRIEVI